MDGQTNGSSKTPPLDLEYARKLDKDDPLSRFRKQFIFPSRADLKRGTDLGHSATDADNSSSDPCTYLCGNSLGLQPRSVSTYVKAQLERWATKGVYGHFKELKDSVIPPWMQLDDVAAIETAKIVGAEVSEVVVMQTLTANLHLLLASFYRPSAERYKIIIEGKAFPSDHYVVESQLRHHNLNPADAMVLIEPPDPAPLPPLISTKHILSIIDKHADTTALLLLPGIQFYTGQFLDVKTITAYAQAKGITVGWDLAHAIGNVPLSLHDWNVDFAAWCNYKYMNCGPGASGGLFVHSRHTEVTTQSSSSNGTKAPPAYKMRLAGWWGSSKTTRFEMDNNFSPLPGAAGWQLSNPSALDLSAILASLAVFEQTDMTALRERSLRLTGYIEQLLLTPPSSSSPIFAPVKPYTIITPSDPAQRGAQLSVLLEPGLLDTVMEELEENGVVVDERRPDVVRVAPAPIYNSFEDCWRFVLVFREACSKALEIREAGGKEGGQKNGNGNIMVEGGKEAKGWSDIK